MGGSMTVSLGPTLPSPSPLVSVFDSATDWVSYYLGSVRRDEACTRGNHMTTTTRRCSPMSNGPSVLLSPAMRVGTGSASYIKAGRRSFGEAVRELAS